MKKKNLKNGLLALLLVVVMVTGVIGAYFTSTDTATNTFEVGEISIDLQEPSWNGEVPTTPNETVPKDPQILNDGKSDAYVYLTVEVPYANVVTAELDGTKNPQAETELFDYTVKDGWVEVGTAEKDETNGVYRHVYAYASDSSTLTVLSSNETTSKIFDEIKFANVVEAQGLELTSQDVVINAYGIQTEIVGDEITPDYVWSVIKNQFPELSKVLLSGPEFNKTIPDEATSVVFTDEAAPVEGVSTFSLLRSTPEVVDVSEAQDGGVVAWLDGDTYKVSTQRSRVKPLANADSSQMFFNKVNLTKIDADFLNTSSTTSMFGMFAYSYNIEELDLSSWDTSNVTSMAWMFGYNKDSGMALRSLDLSNFDMSKVQTTYCMFQCCINLENLQLPEKFVASENKNIAYMFRNCSNLATLNVSDWDTENVTDMSNSFYGCANLVNLDTSNWNVENVINMKNMFRYCSSLSQLDVSNWKMKKVTDASFMFSMNSTNNYASGAMTNLQILDVSNWDVSNVKSMKAMFQNCVKLEGLDVSKWNTENVTDMSYMFYGVGYALSEEIELDVSSFDTSNVTTMNHMFAHSTNTVVKGYENWNVENVEIFNGLFHSTNNRVCDFSNWSNSKVTDMAQMFDGCSYLEEIRGLNNFKTSNVTHLEEVFAGCSSLTSVDVSGWDTSNVVYFLSAFSGCSSLEEIVGLENWNTSSGTLFTNFIAGCRSLKSINLSNLDTRNAKPYTNTKPNYEGMENFFKNNHSLEEVIVGENFDFDGDGTATGFVFPTPSVSGSDGKWYNIETKEAFTPDSIPSNTSATYSAFPQ